MWRILKWTLGVIVLLAVAGFGVFLYVIPPFFLVAPETFAGDIAKAPPPVDGIADPLERAIAARGRYLVTTHGCIGCHATNGPQGPDLTKYLAGGGIRFQSAHWTLISRNLTPDKETGLARRTDDEVKRVLTSGVMPDSRVTSYTVMPWAAFSNWSEEDRHAVLTYLRHLPAVRHEIPDAKPGNAITEPGAVEQAYGFKDYGTSPAVAASQ